MDNSARTNELRLVALIFCCLVSVTLLQTTSSLLDPVLGDEDDENHNDSNNDNDHNTIGHNGEFIISGCVIIDGTNDPDFIISCDASTVVYGKGGDDEIQTGFGIDQVFGGDGNDVIQSNGQKDQIFGNSGDDNLIASDDNDLLSGGPGNDNLFAGFGDDQLHGGSGDDIFDCGEGIDEIKDFDRTRDIIVGLSCEIY